MNKKLKDMNHEEINAIPDLTGEEFLKTRYKFFTPITIEGLGKMLEEYRDEFQSRGFWGRFASRRQQERNEAIKLLRQLSEAIEEPGAHQFSIKERVKEFLKHFNIIE